MEKVTRLLASRKFWAGTVALIVTGLLFWQGLITAEQLSRSVVVVVGLYMGSVALEDGLVALFALWAVRDRAMMREMREDARELQQAMTARRGDTIFG